MGPCICTVRSQPSLFGCKKLVNSLFSLSLYKCNLGAGMTNFDQTVPDAVKIKNLEVHCTFNP